MLPGDTLNSPNSLYRHEANTSRLMRKPTLYAKAKAVLKSTFAHRDQSITLDASSNNLLRDDSYLDDFPAEVEDDIVSPTPKIRIPCNVVQAQSQSVKNSSERFDWLNSSNSVFDNRKMASGKKVKNKE